ncbi:expansin EXLX1 family cellulose-binding protein [Micromonospora cathayae]|uniref:Expansin EXLX1 family cellulose-binding protein n=1 Tax=Micromonospora cathayae TaxID=3028804 RepID=A0ABY7ZZG3_9ACTN|nr:expansin EXLX1 family cellulose-binding protein [Micromonospora sp. HUAS 3]WDZ87144.1 expansin EXLX1 family cellulose-binding protein [Micromonospora sp. HUAS 3]
MTDPCAVPRPGPGRRRRATHPGRGRWLAGGALTALAAVVALGLVLRAGEPPAPCSAPAPGRGDAGTWPVPVAAVTGDGKATFYDSKGAGGNCAYPAAPTDRLYVALGPAEYAAGAACGGHLDVTGPKGTVRVLVMDQCPECPAGHLDLSREAFARIADPVRGVVPVSYRQVVDPSLTGPLTFRIKEGASQWWFAVQVARHGNPLRAVEVRRNGTWRAATRHDYNYWIIEAGAGPGPYAIRVTDVRGHRVTAEGVRLAPGEVQRSDVRMYGGPATAARSSAPGRSPSPRPTTAGPTPSPTLGPTGTAAPTGTEPADAPPSAGPVQAAPRACGG